jgi:hypothetical protein
MYYYATDRSAGDLRWDDPNYFFETVHIQKWRKSLLKFGCMDLRHFFIVLDDYGSFITYNLIYINARFDQSDFYFESGVNLLELNFKKIIYTTFDINNYIFSSKVASFLVIF